MCVCVSVNMCVCVCMSWGDGRGTGHRNIAARAQLRCPQGAAGRPRSWAASASRERRVPGLEGNRTAPFLQRRHVTARDTRTIRARGGTHRDVTRSQRTSGRHQRDGWRFTSSGPAAPPSSPSSAPPAPPLARDVPRWGAAVWSDPAPLSVFTMVPKLHPLPQPLVPRCLTPGATAAEVA